MKIIPKRIIVSLQTWLVVLSVHFVSTLPSQHFHEPILLENNEDRQAVDIHSVEDMRGELENQIVAEATVEGQRSREMESIPPPVREKKTSGHHHHSHHHKQIREEQPSTEDIDGKRRSRSQPRFSPKGRNMSEPPRNRSGENGFNNKVIARGRNMGQQEPARQHQHVHKNRTSDNARGKPKFLGRGRDMGEPDTIPMQDSSPPPPPPPKSPQQKPKQEKAPQGKPQGTIVPVGKNDTKNNTKFDSLLVDLPEYDDTEEEGFASEPPTPPPTTTTTTPRTTITRTTTTKKPTTVSTTTMATTAKGGITTEVLDLIGDDDDEAPVGRGGPSTFKSSRGGPKETTEGFVLGLGTGKKDIKLVEEAGYRPEAKTKYAVFRGLIMNLENEKRVFTFYGIAYATPPVDNLRFKPPFPADPPRDGMFEATRLNPPCFPSRISRSSSSAGSTPPPTKSEHDQAHSNRNTMTVASEDCLYLNIWLPDKVVLEDQPGTPTLFPVLVWIHGEGFLSGMDKSDYKSAAEFVAETDIILVTIQYRLGVFGFLRMGSSEYSGNMGLQDQVQALKWLEENIECFGGDPHAVTLVGHDIGAAFVGFHLLSKISPGYFSRAVMIGGSPLQPHMFHTAPHANQKAMELATQLGCVNSKSVKAIMECLINLDPVSIWEVQILLLQQGHNTLTFPFVPTEDGAVVTSSPLSLLYSGRGKLCPVLLGGSANSGTLVLVNSVEGMLPYNPTFISYDKHLAIMRHILDDFAEYEMDVILHQYKNWENLMDGYANQVRAAEAVGDFYFTCPLRKFSDLWSARGLPTYQFSFAQQSSAKNRSSWMGAVHGDELDYMFGVPLRFPDMFSSEEQEFSKDIMTVLEQFIKTGEPNQGWERYGRETPHFAEFLAGGVFYGTLNEPKYGPRLEHCAFWNDLFPRIASRGGGGGGNPRSSSYMESAGVAANDSMLSQGFRVDESCYVSLHNCSHSTFSIRVN